MTSLERFTTWMTDDTAEQNDRLIRTLEGAYAALDILTHPYSDTDKELADLYDTTNEPTVDEETDVLYTPHTFYHLPTPMNFPAH